MTTLKTWTGKSQFEYGGSVAEGTTIIFGTTHSKCKVEAWQYKNLLIEFSEKTIPVGTSRTTRPPESLGEWIFHNIDKRAIASYVAPILIAEGYATKLNDGIKIKGIVHGSER
ncbi:hypothetical protein [Methylobacter psychrophilus]|uniref:hypothetical protein n=1 Tax=Methylobacter psychrophilus TaxID=96941 RepID=UPI0021D4FD68|nr:hypothetical protein [Methylobacter psychrophilus]